MFKILIRCVAIAALTIAITSCNQAGKPSLGAKEATLCGGCGQLKGTTACCDKSAAVCGGCGLAKGSPGCCKMTKGKSAKLCTGCGQIKGSDKRVMGCAWCLQH